MTEQTPPARLLEYTNVVLAQAHGHQKKSITAMLFALIGVSTCCQAGIARQFANFEAAAKRLSRLLHNNRLKVDAWAKAHSRFVCARLPRHEMIRIAVDWTTEDTQHLLVASLLIGARAVPLYWKAYEQSALKDHTHEYERELVRVLVKDVLKGVCPSRVLLTMDRGFGDVLMLDELKALRVGYILRAKGNVHVEVNGKWQALKKLRFRTYQRRRGLGRVRYCASSPRRVYLTHARARDRKGKWGIWYLISNLPYRAETATREYARRFGCEEGFRDAKRLLGFAKAKIKDIEAWSRMFALVAMAMVVLVGIGQRLLANPAHLAALLRQVRSRRRARSELSLVGAVTRLLGKAADLWELFSHEAKLNLRATL